MSQQIEAPKSLTVPDADFTNQLGQYKERLASMDPPLVVETGKQIADILNQVGRVTIEQAAVQGATRAIDRFIGLQSLYQQYAKRVSLADALVAPSPTEIQVGELAHRFSTLKAAGQEFNVPIEERLTGIVKEKVIFWKDWDIKYEDVSQAKLAVDNVQTDDDLPDDLKARVQAQYSEAAKVTVQRLVESVPGDREISAYDMEESVRGYSEGRKILELLASSPDALDGYTSKVVASLKMGRVMDTVRDNPRGKVYRDGLWLLAHFLREPERIKRGFGELGITAEDLEILFAVSLFEEQAAPFARIAQITGQYDEGRYQTLVRKALQLIIDGTRKEQVDYRDGEVTMYKKDLVTGNGVSQIVETLHATGIPVNDPRVRQAIETAAQRLLDNRADYAVDVTENAKEIREAAKRLGVFDDAETGSQAI